MSAIKLRTIAGQPFVTIRSLNGKTTTEPTHTAIGRIQSKIEALQNQLAEMHIASDSLHGSEAETSRAHEISQLQDTVRHIRAAVIQNRTDQLLHESKLAIEQLLNKFSLESFL